MEEDTIKKALSKELEIFRGQLREDFEEILDGYRHVASEPPAQRVTSLKIPRPDKPNHTPIPGMLPEEVLPFADDEPSATLDDASATVDHVEANETPDDVPRRAKSKFQKMTDLAVSTASGISSGNLSHKMEDQMNGFEKSAKKALGFTVERRAGIELEGARGSMRQKVAQVVRSDKYELFSVCLVLAYAVSVGWQTDHMVRHKLEAVPISFRIADIVFLILFASQIALSLFAFRQKFFYMWGWGWNVFDFILVILQCIEEVATAASYNGQSSGILRTFRIFRTARSLRIIRLLQQLSALRLLVICILESFRSFAYVVLLVGTITYIASIFFTSAVLATLVEFTGMEGKGQASADLAQWYGTLFRTFLSLVQGLTGGLDWNDLFEPLNKHVGPLTGLVFVLWTLFGILAIMNVVTGIFIEHAIAQGDAIKKAHRLERARKMFDQLDLDGSDSITLEELKECLSAPLVQKFFYGLGVQPKQAYQAFECFDADGSGNVDLIEFLNGCNRLQSGAQFGDLMFVYTQLQSAASQQKTILKGIEDLIIQSR